MMIQTIAISAGMTAYRSFAFTPAGERTLTVVSISSACADFTLFDRNRRVTSLGAVIDGVRIQIAAGVKR